MNLSTHCRIAAFCSIVAIPASAAAAPGDLDSTFGAAGVVRLAIGTTTTIHGAALQTDGRIVVAGASDGDFLVARFETDGSPDATFGTGGVVTTSIGDTAGARAVVVQDDGMIVVAGTSTSGGLTSFTLVRYDDGGVPDPGFGTGGIATTTLPSAAANALVLQDDGRLVAAGTSDAGDGGEFTLVRYETDGSVDGTFGVGGIVTTSFSGPGTADTAYALAIRDDQKLVACGRKGSNNFAMARYDTTGTPDPGFGTGGAVSFDITSTCRGLAVQSDGRATAVGVPEQTVFYSVLLRVLEDGSLDPALVSNALPYVPYGMRFYGATSSQNHADRYQPHAVGVDGAGRILMTGFVAEGTYTYAASVWHLQSLERGFLRARLNTDGTPAPFGDEMSVAGTNSFGARALLQQVDTKVVVAGYEGPNRIVVARFLTGTCGNGSVEPDEECEDGNATDGDGCDSNCTVTGCGNTVPTAGEACDDGTGNDADCCTDACAFVPAATACADDGNLCTDDVCDGAGACNTPNTLPCDDGVNCTVDDVCSGGTCGGTDVVCAPCEWCRETDGICVGAQRYDCDVQNIGRLMFRNPADERGDRMEYQLIFGVEDFSEFGDPLTTDDYTFCVFDTAFPPNVVFSARMPAGGQCGNRSCWRERGEMYRYTPGGTGLDGVRSMKLDPDGKADARIKAKGELLNNRAGAIPDLPLALPLVSQLQIENGKCWQSRYESAQENDGDEFSAYSE